MIELISFHNTIIRQVKCKRVMKKLLFSVRASRAKWKSYIVKKMKSKWKNKRDPLITIRRDVLFSSRSRHAFYRTCLMNHTFNALKTKIIAYRNKYLNLRERNTALVANIVQIKQSRKLHVRRLYIYKWVLAVKKRLSKYRKLLLKHRAQKLFKAWERLYNHRIVARLFKNPIETVNDDNSKQHIITDGKVIINSYLLLHPTHT